MIRIAIADDHTLFRQSLALLLQQAPGMELVAEAADGPSLLQALAAMPSLPDIALIDIDMPGMNGVELNEHLQASYPQVKVVVLSIYTQERIISRMINAGASAYLFKNCEKEEFIQAIETTYKSGFYVNKQVFEALQRVKKPSTELKNINAIAIELTNRETEVLRLICQEYNNSEIAEKLALSVRTVEGHRNNLLLKTGCRNTAGLVLFAIRYGFFVA
ncbi:response regulator transcription factor [uncultured Chitinophaga sp.]|uniref:response regulator transcription factor n=1 Tax=uncultured Chitinophaga sp. TaxID=339340 RepID=UPI002619E224|nr:response regulator transcription factor [uncultured Chitinophaga sp.]